MHDDVLPLNERENMLKDAIRGKLKICASVLFSSFWVFLLLWVEVETERRFKPMRLSAFSRFLPRLSHSRDCTKRGSGHVQSELDKTAWTCGSFDAT